MAIRLEHERARNLAEEIRQLHEVARQEAEQNRALGIEIDQFYKDL